MKTNKLILTFLAITIIFMVSGFSIVDNNLKNSQNTNSIIDELNQNDPSADLNINEKQRKPILGQNPVTETISASWTTLAVSPKPQSRSFCVYAKPRGTEYIYHIGGGSGSTLKSIARYNIASNTWSILTTVLNLDVSSGAAINDGDSVIYIFGGNNSGSATLGSTQKFNIGTGIVTTMATMPTLVTDAAVVRYHDSLVYVIGGGSGLFGAGYFSNVQVYNLKRNTYAIATSYPISAGMMGFGIDGNKIICSGGWNGAVAIANSYKGVIDPSNHLNITWSAIPDYPAGAVTRMASYFVKLGLEKGIMMTGGAINGSSNTNKTYLFNTSCETWDSSNTNSQARSNFKAVGRGDSVAWVVAGFTTVGVGTTERITYSSIKCTNSGIKIYEHFSDVLFPQEGWSKINLISGNSEWGLTAYNARTIPSAALSGSSITGTNNSLVTERFTPYNGDSLVFYFRQSSATVYNDSLDVRISTTDSLVPSFAQRLILLKDGVNYPAAGTYGKFAVPLSAYAGQNCWIAFNHVSSGIDTVMLDDIRVGTPPADYVNVDLITQPIDTASDEETIIPSAIIINEGFNNATIPFPITFEITGQPNYTNTIYDTLSFGGSREVFFDSVYNQMDTGDYNMTVYTSFGSEYDGNGGGNILRKSPKKKQLKKLLKKFKLRKGNRGLGVTAACATYFTTSIILNTTNKPSFNWKPTNTIHEKILIKNGQDVSGGLYHSIDGLDNGYFDVINALPAGKEIRICNEGRTNVFISTNGVIGVENSAPGGISGGTHKTPDWDKPLGTAYYPLWMDLDFSLMSGYSENMLSYRVINYTDGNSVLVVSYYRVRVTDPSANENRFVSFQVCIELLPAGVQDNSNYRYSYFVTDQNDPVKRTGSKFLEEYENFKFGQLNDHIVGVTHSGGYALYYRYRIKPPTKNIRRKKTGLILSESEDNFAVEFSKYENDCKVCDGKGEDALGIPCDSTNFRILKQGFYNGGQYTVRDTFTVYLRNSTAPYAIVDTVKAFSDSLGNLVCRFCKASPTGTYYIVIKNRNALETWSATAVTFVNGSVNYDFTTAASKAYGNNMIQVGSKWCIYSGDVSQDGAIDIADVSFIDNDANSFVSGYVVTDINGDNFVDLSDLIIADNNSSNFVYVVRP